MLPIAGNLMDGAYCVAGKLGSCGAVVVPKVAEYGVLAIKTGGKWVFRYFDDAIDSIDNKVDDILDAGAGSPCALGSMGGPF